MDYDQCYKKVLSTFAFDDPEVQLIRHNENITYKVTEKGAGNAYLLRLHKPIAPNMQGIQTTRAAIESEQHFLHAWSKAASWPVQTPVLNRDGEFVSRIVIEGEEVCCSVLKWVEGEMMTRDDFKQERAVRMLGERIGGLHLFSQSYEFPLHFCRPEYGSEWLKTMLEQLRSGRQSGVISNPQMEVLEHVFCKVSSQVEEVIDKKGQWGFIHADIHYSNLIRNAAGISLIDFGLSGFGPYAMDLAMAGLFMHRELRNDLLSGYSAVISAEISIELLEALSFLAIAGHYAFVVSREDRHRWVQERMPRFIEHFCEPYLAGKPVF